MMIRFAKVEDKERILNFIKTHWASDHIFVTWPQLFDYCHSLGEERLSYVLAEDENTGVLYGICGYIPCNRLPNPDIWIALWKVIPSGIPSLGMNLLQYMQEHTHCRTFCCCGIKESVKPLYRFLGYHTDTMDQYYRLADRPQYQVARIVHKNILPVPPASSYVLRPIDSAESLRQVFDPQRFSDRRPFKDLDYLIYRYYRHICYRYLVWGIFLQGEPQKASSILVGREVRHSGQKLLRLVDFIGREEELAEIGGEIQRLLEKNDYEYVDFYEYGIHPDILNRMGFVKREKTDENLLPNYFEPFLQENVDIHLFTNIKEGFTMFKADGDQDRPNLIPDERDDGAQIVK